MYSNKEISVSEEIIKEFISPDYFASSKTFEGLEDAFSAAKSYIDENRSSFYDDYPAISDTILFNYKARKVEIGGKSEKNTNISKNEQIRITAKAAIKKLREKQTASFQKDNNNEIIDPLETIEKGREAANFLRNQRDNSSNLN